MQTNNIMKFSKSTINVSQNDHVSLHLLEGKSFSVTEAIQAGITNPTAVVSTLRKEGFPILTFKKKNSVTYSL